MKIITDDLFIEQIRSEENTSFELLYKFYFPSIAYHIKQNAGSKEDAEDIFQEAIVVLLQKVRQDNFILTSSLKTYLFAIAKNLWLKRLRDEELVSLEDEDLVLVLPGAEAEIFEIETQLEKSDEQKVQTWLEKITENCQRILKAIFFYEEPMDSLMKKMGWKNKHTAANQKYKCIEQVKKESKK